MVGVCLSGGVHLASAPVGAGGASPTGASPTGASPVWGSLSISSSTLAGAGPKHFCQSREWTWMETEHSGGDEPGLTRWAVAT